MQFYLPMDYIYYGHTSNHKLFHSNSSGIAAHTTYEEAQKRAFAELLERDAVMRSWYEKKAPAHLNQSILPLHAKRRIAYWQENNRQVHILNLSSEYIYIFLVLIVSSSYPCFVSGSAASFDSYEVAIFKALQEAEYSLLLALEKPCKAPPLLEHIKTPLDHGQYYHFQENAEKLRWLYSSSVISKLSVLRENNYRTAEKHWKTIYFDLSESPIDLIKVVRAFSKRCIPINFGYQQDYYLHPEVQNLNIDPSIRELPHYFA